jgi:hypothetical protein
MWSRTNPCGNQQEKPWFATGVLMEIWQTQVTSTNRSQKSLSLGEAWLEETSIRKWWFHFFCCTSECVSSSCCLIIWHSFVTYLCCTEMLLSYFLYRTYAGRMDARTFCFHSSLYSSLKIACTDGAIIRPARIFRLKCIQCWAYS